MYLLSNLHVHTDLSNFLSLLHTNHLPHSPENPHAL